MASISTLRIFPDTQVTPAIEAIPATSSALTSGDTNSHVTSNRQADTPRDQAQFSATGTVLARALNLSDVRHDKVAALQQAIVGGTYSVSSIALAGWLIESLTA